MLNTAAYVMLITVVYVYVIRYILCCFLYKFDTLLNFKVNRNLLFSSPVFNNDYDNENGVDNSK